MVEYYRKFGFDATAEAQRLQKLRPKERVREFIQQRESYVNHLTEDQAVSIKFSYWLNPKGEIFTSPSTNDDIYNIKNQIDPSERNGSFYPGILRATALAKDNQYNLISLYSPTGKKLFNETIKDNLPEEKLEFLEKPYDAGQLYFMYFDGQKLDCLAVSVKSDDNPWLLQLGLNMFTEEKDEEKRIMSILNSPVDLGNVDDFFSRDWPENYLIHHNVHHKDFYLNQVLSKMKDALSSRQKMTIDLKDKTIIALQKYEVTADMVTVGYLTALHRHMQASVQPIGGGCGGSIADKNEIEMILGINSIMQDSILPKLDQLVSSFSSTFRYIRQQKEEKYEFHDGECVSCHQHTKVGPCNICGTCAKKYD